MIKSYPTGLEATAGEPAGRVSAYAHVPMVNIFGKETMRRVSLGVDYSISLADARAKVEETRRANQNLHVAGRFTVDL